MLPRRAFLQSLAAAALRRRPRITATPRRVLYISGRLSSPSAATVRRTVATLGPSAFNVIILAFLYARFRAGNLRLTYNGVPFARLQPDLERQLRSLRAGFPTRKRLLLCLGGWGNAASFAAIRSAGVAAFLRQLDREAIEPLGLEGLDLDLEPGTAAENTAAGWHAAHDEFGATLVAITNGYRARHPDHIVTHAPIASVAAGLYARDGGVAGVRGSFFEATRRPEGGNNLSWINVQFYEAGDPMSPKAPAIWQVASAPQSIAAFYQTELLQPLLRRRAATGLSRPWEALAPGFEPHYHQDRAFCAATLRELVHQSAACGPPAGVFLWQYGQIAADILAWGRDLERAL